MLAKMSVDQALMKAKSHIKNNEITEAQKLYQTVLLAFPHNKRAQQGLASLNKSNPNDSLKSPSQDAINQLMSLYNQGQLSLVVQQAKDLTEQYPEAFIIWNICNCKFFIFVFNQNNYFTLITCFSTFIIVSTISCGRTLNGKK